MDSDNRNNSNKAEAYKKDYKAFLGDFKLMRNVVGSTLAISLENETGFTYRMDRYQISVNFQENPVCKVRVSEGNRSLEGKIDLSSTKDKINWAEVLKKSIGVVRKLMDKTNEP